MAIKPTRIIVWIVIATIIVALSFALRPKPEEADFATVTKGPFIVTVDEEGETRVHDRFLVSAPVAGHVLRIEHEPGDPVIANKTTLATFLPSDPMLLDARARAEAEARVKAAEAALERVRVEETRALAERDFAESEYERHVELDENNLIAKDRLESAELQTKTTNEAVRSAEFTVRAAEFELEVAQASLLQTRDTPGSLDTKDTTIILRSPINGVVLRRIRESEGSVPAGELLLEIADPTRLEIVSDLLSTEAVKVKTENRVLIEQWGGSYTLKGRVRRVEPYGFKKFSALGVEEQRVNVIIDFEDVQQAWNELGDGYRVEVRIVIWESDNTLKTPTSSLFRQGNDWAVYVVEYNHAVLRKVKVGQRNSFEAEILEGLQANDLVIEYPSDKITDGIEVVERKTRPGV